MPRCDESGSLLLLPTMSSPQVTELRLAATKEEAIQAILAELPDLAIVRDEEDGVGKFAGQRTVVVVGTDRDKLMMFDDTFGNIKPRLDKGQLEVELEEVPQGTIARITAETAPPKGPMGHVMDVVQNGIAVAAVYAGYHWWKSLPIDYTMLAAIGAGGGVVWTAAAVMLAGKGSKEPQGLPALVPRALAPLEAEDADDDDDE